MPRPVKLSRTELALKRENNRLTTALILLRTELAAKISFTSRLQYLLSLRAKHVDDLNGKIQQLRDRLAAMVQSSPQS